MAPRKSKAGVKEKYPEWRPWGLYDDKTVPKVPEEAITEAADLINHASRRGVSREWLEKRIQEVALGYAADRRTMQQPPLEWYRRRVEAMRKATTKLLQTIGASSNDIKFWSFRALVNYRMGRRLQSSHPEQESIEQILKEFEKVCAEALRRKGAPGAKQELHVQAAVKALSSIWFECTGSPVPISLDTEIEFHKKAGNPVSVEPSAISEGSPKRSSEGFTSPGPRFCQLVLQSIDPDLSVSQIETAIRNALGKQQMRKFPKS